MSGSGQPADQNQTRNHESAEQIIAKLRHVQAPLHYTPAHGDTNWYHYTHQHLYAMLMSANPAAVHERARAVRTYASHIDDTANAVAQAARNMLGTWSGSAADVAAQNVNQITDWADQTIQTVGEIAQGFTDYASTLDTARNSMPEPIDWGAVNKALSGGTVHLNTSGYNSATIAAIAAGKKEDEPEAQAKELQNKQNAVDVMSRYHETSTSIAAAMPAPTAPPGVQPAGSIPVRGPGPITRPTSPVTTTITSGTGPTSVQPPPTNSGVGAGGGTGGYRPDANLIGGFGSGGLVNADGGWGGSGSPSGTGAAKVGGAMSGVAEGTEQTAVGQSSGRAGAAPAGEGEEGWGGFGGGAGAGRGGDSEHHDKYSAEANLIGTLPESFPPVLGL